VRELAERKLRLEAGADAGGAQAEGAYMRAHAHDQRRREVRRARCAVRLGLSGADRGAAAGGGRHAGLQRPLRAAAGCPGPGPRHAPAAADSWRPDRGGQRCRQRCAQPHWPALEHSCR
jgi:hypothetical protein